MIANFFQNLNSSDVDYLLISGQATVLYGAATFSEDIDLWVNPTPDNWEKFLNVLRSCAARYYKLTPAFTLDHLKRGHGFHFVLPDEITKEVFLDVMGVPPRVASFDVAVSAARWMETQWGKVHTIGLKELVELKKTQRLEDYPIISNLALAWFDQPACPKTKADFDWAIENIFTLTALRSFFEENPEVVDFDLRGTDHALRIFGQHVTEENSAPEETQQVLTAAMQQRMSALQQADRFYWRNIISELKQLRAGDELMNEGDSV